MNEVHAYEINSAVVDAASFTAAACHPAHSVVVEACAGSGKTWLLVARMLRLLLAGTKPDELLAITFTRKAAQEMRSRLFSLLHELAVADDEIVRLRLLERGVRQEELAYLMPKARALYVQVLSSAGGLSIDTFHSWFARLLQFAPLSSGVPQGFSLAEATAELRHEAYRVLMQSMLDAENPKNQEIRQALIFLYQELGDVQTRKMLDTFLDKRTEWWAANQSSDGSPIECLRELVGNDLHIDARLSIWEDSDLMQRLRNLALCLGEGAKTNQDRANKICFALDKGPTLENFFQLVDEFFNADGKPRANRKTKDLLKAIEQSREFQSETQFDDEYVSLGNALQRIQRRSDEQMVVQLNQAVFLVGDAYIHEYQHLKSSQRVLDFSDLEWQAFRLSTNQESGMTAYLQARLDARYKHILLDEFQDTNPLQWQIIRAWLEAYGGDLSKPSVFVVGDPKQSIYRFRRAEPRVFNAAKEMLVADGAYFLRTNQTRRNAQQIVTQLNVAMHDNKLFNSQSTSSEHDGQVWRLALVRDQVNSVSEEVRDGEQTDAASRIQLRSALDVPVPEQEDQRRFNEGSMVANALWVARQQAGSVWKWSEVMLLVRRRTHLSAYEQALRAAGIPFVSNRRGGLLDALEIADLIALLSFLTTPGDNRALAHVLKSPIADANDESLIQLAQIKEATWWSRLAVLVEQGQASENLIRIHRLLQRWLEAAHHLPVHDLLDQIYHEGEIPLRYARRAVPEARSQVLGNLTKFIELALNLDAGRYPSLPKFMLALNAYQQYAQDDAPDESSVDASTDAVRILTIHSAKGLEADIVVLMDANHSAASEESLGVLCYWPLEADQKMHFSVYGKKDQRGVARDAIFSKEKEQAAQENLNLLYVAATRAKKHLIISGIASTRGADGAGVIDQSWYQHFLQAECVEFEATSHDSDGAPQDTISLNIFAPPDLHLPAVEMPEPSSQEQVEGIAMHALMERMSHQIDQWPVTMPKAEVIAAWLPCSLSVAASIRAQVEMILANPALEQFFNPKKFLTAHNEMEIWFQKKMLRLDRVVHFYEEIWVLDYKRQYLPSEVPAYQTQIREYKAALRAVNQQKSVRAGLILSNGSLIEIN